jgi:uncharacterized protein YneF (UPF0154 family)
MDQEKKKSPLYSTPLYIYIIIGLLLLVLVLLGYFIFFQSKKETLKTNDNTLQLLEDYKNAQKLSELEKKANEIQSEIVSISDVYKDKTGDKSLVGNLSNLSPEEQTLLKQRIADEKDISLKSLLQEILEKNKEIWELRAKIAEIEIKLPPPHIAREGETHFQVAMDFLINEKQVDKKQTQKLIESTLLMEPLKPGFKVWNFYSEGVFLSSVTQGNALISPNTLVRQEKKELVDSRDKAVSQRNRLAAEIKILEKRKVELQELMNHLMKEKEKLISRVFQLNEQVNSLSYVLDSEKNLKKRGVLKGGFLKSTKLRDDSPGHFTESIDLRSQNYISISASVLGIEKIKSVDLYPKLYKKGTDYNVEISPNKQIATVILLEPIEFKSKQLVIAVK